MSVYKRGDVWWVRFQRDGQPIRKSSGSSVKRVAEQFERELKEEYARQKRGGRPRHTYDSMMAKFVREHFPTMKPKAAMRYATSMKALKPEFDGKHIDEINKAAIAKFISSRKKTRVSDATIIRDLACLSSALSCAVDWDWLEYNVCKSVRFQRTLKESKPRVRWLTEKEYTAVLDHASGWVVPIIILLVETGMRLGELLSTEWKNIDLDRREIYLPDSKTGAPRVVPLSDAGWAQIRTQPRHMKTALLFFTAPGKQLSVNATSRAIKRAMTRADIKDARAHDLRHTFASWFLQRGGRIERLKEILGHARIEQTMRYAHLSTADLHEEMRRVGTRIVTDATDMQEKASN